jgi:hypothetical protein
MRTAYRYAALLIMAGVVVQAMVIALGMFALAHDVDGGRPFDQNSTDPVGVVLHGVVGEMVLPLLALLLVSLGLVADVAGGVKAALLVLVAVIVQILTGFASFSVPPIGLLHGLGAFAVLWAAAAAAKLAAEAGSVRGDRATGSATARPRP